MCTFVRELEERTGSTRTGAAVEWLGAEEYWLARWLFQRALGAIYVLAFVAVVHQWRGLLGDDGLTPARRFVERMGLRQSPSVFHWRYSDGAVVAAGWLGIGLSLAAVLGFTESGPIVVSMGTWIVLWALYLSLLNIGQVWYAFGWESLLVEAGFLAIFLGPADVAPPLLVIWLLRWLLFRVEFGAGLIKLRGDPCWRDLTCLEYHHETQPMPNPLSWYFHHLPRWAHRIEVGANHVTQLAIPFLVFTPQPIASIGGTVIVVTQTYLMVSGNFAWLNALTLVLGFTALNGGFLDALLPASPPADLAAPPVWFGALAVALTALVAVRSVPVVRNLLSPGQAMNRSFDALRLVNTYGAFGSITKTRYEIAVEGTLDDPADPFAEWREYGFKGKPTDVRCRPPQVAPYHLRLDWLMWFAAMSPSPGFRDRWFLPFLEALLSANPRVLALLRDDPFDGEPPRAVRALRYRYRFASSPERRDDGAWWTRDPVGTYVPAITRSVREEGRREW